MTFNSRNTILPTDLFQGQTAVITGAGRGIGRAIAELLAAHGARIVIAEISPEGADCASAIQQSGGQALFVQTDVSDPRSVQSLADQTGETYGQANILVNNAILSPICSVLEMQMALWDQVMAVNLRGTFLTCKAFLPGMLANRRGTIINMVSTEALPHMSAYMASKQGIAAFSRSLAGEVGEQGVQVVAFAPGFVDTPGLRAAARGLAPHMQLDEETFLNLSFHPAYNGAMPVADAALATALLIDRYMDLYHGDQVDGYSILERAGVIAADGYVEAAPAVAPSPTSSAAGVNRAELVQSLARQLLQVLAETEKEFNRLPIFVRPMARQGFKGKSGRALPDWQHSLEVLLQAFDENTAEAGTLQLPVEAAWIAHNLSGLARYYHEVPAETGRFTRDQAVLAEISTLAQQREQLAVELGKALEGFR